MTTDSSPGTPAYQPSNITPCSGCGALTPWQHYSGCPYLPTSAARPAPSPSPQVSGLGTGWQCPVCRQVYAPWVYSCPGYGHTSATTGTNTASQPSQGVTDG